MKIWTSNHTFGHSWDTVVQAAWRKYPNPMNPSVVGVDVIDRKVDDKGVLHSNRLLSTEWGLPTWVIKLVGMDQTCFVNEHSEVNSQNQVMTLTSRNLTFCNVVSIDETLVYSPHPEDPQNKTLLTQEAMVSVNGVPMSSYCESIIKSTISSKATMGRQAMEWVIGKITDEAQDLTRVAKEEMSGFTRAAKEEMSGLTRAAKEEMSGLTRAAKEEFQSSFSSTSL